MTYLKWQDAAAWMACPGRPALEESEGLLPDEVPALTKEERTALEGRKTALSAATAVEILPLQALPVGGITGERGALGFGSVVLAEYPDHASLEVYPADRLLGLAALIKFSILHQFTNTNVGNPEELFAWGQTVTEAGQFALNLRASITALEHLVPGDYCPTCRAAYRCPAYAKVVHETVYGPNEAPDDPEAVPLPVPVTLEPSSEWARLVLPRLPVIEAWVEQVKRAAGLFQPPAPVKRRKKRKLKRARGAPESA